MRKIFLKSCVVLLFGIFLINSAEARVTCAGTDATGNFFVCGGINDHDPNTSSLSMSIWFRADDSSGWTEGGWIMIWQGEDGTNADGLYGCLMLTDGTIDCYSIMSNATLAEVTSVSAYDDGLPHLLGYNFDYTNHNLTIFIDGVSVGTDNTVTSAAPKNSTQYGLHFCRRDTQSAGWNEQFIGEIWDAHYWIGYDLILADHQNMYNSRIRGLNFGRGAAWYMPFDDKPAGLSGLNGITFIEESTDNDFCTCTDANSLGTTVAESYLSYPSVN